MRPKKMRIELIHREFKIKWEELEVKSEPTHWHDVYELELFTEGKGKEVVCGKEFEIKRGCMQLLRMTDYHELEIEEPTRAIRFYIPEKCLPEHTVRSIRKSKAVIITYLDEKVASSIEAMYKLLDGCSNNDTNEDVIYSKEALINMIMMGFLWSRNENPADHVKGDDMKVLDVEMYICEHIRERITLESVAKAFDMNPQYLNRIFSKYAGCGIYAYAKRCRLNYSARVAIDTKLSSMEIYEQSGYSSYSNFLRDFKLLYGMSPLQYRKKKLAERQAKNEK